MATKTNTTVTSTEYETIINSIFDSIKVFARPIKDKSDLFISYKEFQGAVSMYASLKGKAFGPKEVSMVYRKGVDMGLWNASRPDLYNESALFLHVDKESIQHDEDAAMEVISQLS
jgi:hypothetical protein